MPVNHQPEHQRFELDDGDATAFARYFRQDDTMVLTHTYVPTARRGRGLAAQLARAAFQYARDHRLTVSIRCHYMAAWIRQHPEFQDLLTD